MLFSLAGSGDKSWADIASEVKNVATDVVKKLGSSINKAVESIAPTKAEEPRRPTRQDEQRNTREDLFPTPNIGGGILGKMVGRWVGNMVNQMASELRDAAEQVAEVQGRAANIIQSSSKVRDRLGSGIEVMPAISQSSQYSNINGRVTRIVTMYMPVAGPRAQATAEVKYYDNDDDENMEIMVNLQNGEVIKVTDGGSGGNFRTIDVEWKSVD